MTQIPSTQYAIQIVGKEEFVVNPAKPVDPVGPTQIMLEVEACGICFSDTKLLHQFDGHPRKSDVVAGIDLDALKDIPSYHPNQEAVTPGHEPVVRVVQVGEKISRKVSLDIGRVHYDFTRFCGTTGSDPREGYAWIPANGDLRENDRCVFVGAAGPMGVMHTMRAVTSGVPGLSVVGTDLSDERLENLTKVVGPTAEKNGVPLDIVNTSSTPLEYGYTYATCLVPVPALVSQAVDLLAEGGILNAFAGIPAGTFGDFDLQGIIERQIFMLGTSGSDVSDMRTVLRKIEAGIIDTTISLWAITGMAGFGDAINAVMDRTSGGKIMVFPMMHDLGLTPVSELAEKLPTVAAKLDAAGLWTKEAEEALLATR